ncbi:MAG TPA: hypothetical protein VKH63_12405 [Candidatus Acidoferrum sp.]|nr:hypothetical protein [Candidatus Acidoferrum sp.]
MTKLARSLLVCLLTRNITFARSSRIDAGPENKLVAASHAAAIERTEERSQVLQSPGAPKDITDRIFKRENQEQEIVAAYLPIIETYIQIEKPNPLMSTVPKSDLYFLGLGDFHGKSMKVHSMTEKTHKGSIMWSFEP